MECLTHLAVTEACHHVGLNSNDMIQASRPPLFGEKLSCTRRNHFAYEGRFLYGSSQTMMISATFRFLYLPMMWAWLNRARPERPHRSGDIQKGKLPIVLENQFCSGTCTYILKIVSHWMCFLDFEYIYIYICLFLSHLLVNTFWLPFYFLHPQAPDHMRY